LADGGVGDGKGLMNPGLGQDHIPHPVVLEADYRVGHTV
jgi:hypothetical protein